MSATRWIYHDQAIVRLRDACRGTGAKAWGNANGFSGSFISDVINGRRDVSEKLALALGLQRMVVFYETKATRK